MNAKEIIVNVMKEKGINQTMLAKMLGVTGQSTVSMALKRDMKISVYAWYLDAMGYELVVRKKSAGRKGEGVYVVDPKGDVEK